MSEGKASTGRRWVKRIAWGILVVVCAILGGSALSNMFFSARSDVVDEVTDLDKARVAEAFHLRSVIGDSLWKGWADAKIPVIIYNEEYAFLIGISNPDSGWRTVPQDLPRGGPWEIVPSDSIDGKEYYRLQLSDGRAAPQAFTVRVGTVWAASMTTKEWTRIKMGNEIRDGLPSLIRPFVPYRLIARIFLGLAMNTDAYIGALGHESFHAFQGMVAANRLASAEHVLGRLGGSYPWDDPSFNNAWKTELSMLGDALSEKEEKRSVELVRKFMTLRRVRRLSFHLDSTMVNLERLREWEEGLGKYTELALWKRAAADSSYSPVKELSNDSDFDGYKGFARRWAQELSTLRLQSHGDESRFYYAGMAQGFLLDRLLPDWRTRILSENVFLEDLVDEAIALHGI
jgi:hypothetical protein